MNESDHRTSVTPIKKSMKFQKEKGSQDAGDLEQSRFKKYDATLNGRKVQLLHDPKTDEIIIDNKIYSTKVIEKEGLYIATVNKTHVYSIEHHDGQIFLEGRFIDFDFKPSVPKLIRQTSSKGDEELIQAPLPGHVVGISVKVGQKVSAGDKILTLEAMKMQNELVSQKSGIIKDIYVVVGDLVSTGDKLVLITQ